MGCLVGPSREKLCIAEPEEASVKDHKLLAEPCPKEAHFLSKQGKGLLDGNGAGRSVLADWWTCDDNSGRRNQVRQMSSL